MNNSLYFWSITAGLVRKAGFKGGGGMELFFSGFCKIAACVNLGVTLKALSLKGS